MYYFVVAWDTFLNKWSSRVLNLSAVIAHSSGYRILSQQYSSLSSVSACVPAREEEEERRWTLRLCPFFYKAISNSLQCLLDNPDTVHLLQQQGFMVSFQFSLFFFFFFFNMQGILPASAGVRVTAQVFPAEEKKGHCLWQRTKTFRIAVTQPSLNTPFSDLAGSTVNGQLSCLIQQPERWLPVQGSNTGMQAKFN